MEDPTQVKLRKRVSYNCIRITRIMFILYDAFKEISDALKLVNILTENLMLSQMAS